MSDERFEVDLTVGRNTLKPALDELTQTTAQAKTSVEGLTTVEQNRTTVVTAGTRATSQLREQTQHLGTQTARTGRDVEAFGRGARKSFEVVGGSVGQLGGGLVELGLGVGALAFGAGLLFDGLLTGVGAIVQNIERNRELDEIHRQLIRTEGERADSVAALATEIEESTEATRLEAEELARATLARAAYNDELARQGRLDEIAILAAERGITQAEAAAIVDRETGDATRYWADETERLSLMLERAGDRTAELEEEARRLALASEQTLTSGTSVFARVTTQPGMGLEEGSLDALASSQADVSRKLDQQLRAEAAIRQRAAQQSAREREREEAELAQIREQFAISSAQKINEEERAIQEAQLEWLTEFTERRNEILRAGADAWIQYDANIQDKLQAQREETVKGADASISASVDSIGALLGDGGAIAQGVAELFGGASAAKVIYHTAEAASEVAEAFSALALPFGTGSWQAAAHFLAAGKHVFAAAQHGISSGGGRGGGGGGGGGFGGGAAIPRPERPVAASPEGLSGVTITIDNRGAVGVDGNRVADQIMQKLNSLGQRNTGRRFHPSLMGA